MAHIPALEVDRNIIGHVVGSSLHEVPGKVVTGVSPLCVMMEDIVKPLDADVQPT